MSKYKEIYKGLKKPLGLYTLSNFGGLVIYALDSFTCVSGFDFGEGAKGVKETTIHYTTLGRPYIIRYQKAYYFDEIERINK